MSYHWRPEAQRRRPADKTGSDAGRTAKGRRRAGETIRIALQTRDYRERIGWLVLRIIRLWQACVTVFLYHSNSFELQKHFSRCIGRTGKTCDRSLFAVKANRSFLEMFLHCVRGTYLLMWLGISLHDACL
jgi:hypothetical protein